MSKTPVKETLDHHPAERRRILVVGNRGYFSRNIISHSVQLAGRLGYDLVAVSVDSGGSESLHPRSAESCKEIVRQAAAAGIRCDHVKRAGDFGMEIEDTIREIKRIELAVIDAGAGPDKIREVTIPVVSVSSAPTDSKGGKSMPAETAHETTKSGQIARTVGYGLLTAGLYAAVFTNSDTVMQYFTKGGWYAAFPIATVFLFSFTHGFFAHHLWSLLGIEAIRKDRVRQTERKIIEKRKTARKRPRMYAYVNPFHRIDKG